jgi:hypothetical protein
MATISTPDVIKEVLHARGFDDGMEWVRIYSYEGLSGEQLFSIFHDARYDDMNYSPYVKNPVLLMYDGILTDEGAEFLGVDVDIFNNTDLEDEE